MKNFKLLSLLGIALIAGFLTGCVNNTVENVENVENVDNVDNVNVNDENNGNVIDENTTSETSPVVEYNNALVDLATQCIASEDYIWDTLDDENSSIEDIQNTINSAIAECTTAKEGINSLGGWEGDNSLVDGILALLDKELVYYNKFNDLVPFLDMGEFTDEENEAYEALFNDIDSISLELEEANDYLIQVQEDFSRNHGFELESEE